MKVANIYAKVNKFEKSEFLVRSLVESKNMGDETVLIYKYFQIYKMGMLFLREEKRDSAFHFWTKALEFHEKNPSFQLSSIIPTFTLWILDQSNTNSLDSLFLPFKTRLQDNFENEILSMQPLSQIVLNFDKSNPRAQIAYNHLERALNDLETDMAIQMKRDLRYKWMVKNKEYQKALRLIYLENKSNKVSEDVTLLKPILDLNKRRQAFLLYKLGRYEECLKSLESSLEKIDQHGDLLPDNRLILRVRKMKVFEVNGNEEAAKELRTNLGKFDDQVWSFVKFK